MPKFWDSVAAEATKITIGGIDCWEEECRDQLGQTNSSCARTLICKRPWPLGARGASTRTTSNGAGARRAALVGVGARVPRMRNTDNRLTCEPLRGTTGA